MQVKRVGNQASGDFKLSQVATPVGPLSLGTSKDGLKIAYFDSWWEEQPESLDNAGSDAANAMMREVRKRCLWMLYFLLISRGRCARFRLNGKLHLDLRWPVKSISDFRIEFPCSLPEGISSSLISWPSIVLSHLCYDFTSSGF